MVNIDENADNDDADVEADKQLKSWWATCFSIRIMLVQTPCNAQFNNSAAVSPAVAAEARCTPVVRLAVRSAVPLRLLQLLSMNIGLPC